MSKGQRGKKTINMLHLPEQEKELFTDDINQHEKNPDKNKIQFEW